MRFPSKLLRNTLIFLHYATFTLFLYSGINKWLEVEIFINTLNKSPFFSGINIDLLAYIIILIELGIPVLIFFDATKKIGFFVSFFLLFVFTGYIIMMLILSPYLPCSCGGLIEKLSWTQHVYFNLFFMAISALLYFKSENQYAADYSIIS